MRTVESIDVSRENPVPVEHRSPDLAGLRARLMRQARHLVGDRDVAEDLVQETLIAILHAQSGYRGEACFDTWAIAILRHKVGDWYREGARHRLASLDSVGETGGAQAAGEAPRDEALAGAASTCPDRQFERRELALAIDDCVAALPARSRQLFAMHEQLGFDTDEVCDRLEISAGHCRTLLHRLRLALRGQLLARRLVP